ncbi:MAG: hypothetical protein NTW32_02595 [Chloroflexi bacterium]|nr:hypothetical protein [Chloroflexota bacterium]
MLRTFIIWQQSQSPGDAAELVRVECPNYKNFSPRFLSLSGLALGGMVLASCAPTTPQVVEPTAEPAVTSVDEALTRLKEGNQRYIANKTVDPNQTEKRRVDLAKGQHPFATILGCVDSRVPPELIFDRGLGDLFVIRTAGQVLDKAVVSKQTPSMLGPYP